MSFDFAWAQAVTEGNASVLNKFRAAAKSIKISFVLLPKEVDFELHKWVLWERNRRVSRDWGLWGGGGGRGGGCDHMDFVRSSPPKLT